MHTRTSWLRLGLLCGWLLLPGLARVAVGQQRVVPRPAPLNTWQPVTWQPSTLFTQLESGDSRIEPAAQLLRLAVLDPAGAAWVLSPGRGHEVSGATVQCLPQAAATDGNWWAAPAGSGLLRIATYQAGQIYALSTSRNHAVTLRPLAEDGRQLWRVVHGRGKQQFVLENAFSAGQCLTHLGQGQLALQPISFVTAQLWMPYVAPILPSYQPFWRAVAQEIRANPALPPARIELSNSHRSALIVRVGDSRRPNAEQNLRIEAGGSASLTLDRDAGATLLETIEIRSAGGVWDRRQLATPIPARAFYDLSIYEEHLQSIAIDRTGKSPNPIEDINYVSKSLGRIALPAGAQLPEQARIDVFAEAKAANNPGAVRPLDPRLMEDEAEPRPLESILNQLRPTQRRSF